MKPFIHDITGINYLEAFLAVKDKPYSLLLDSSDSAHKNSRYSFVMCNPVEIIEIKDSDINDPFAYLRERIKSWSDKTETIPNLPPFQGGAAGLFSYDLGRYLEDIPNIATKNSIFPDMAVGIYDQVLAHDHLLNKSFIFTHAKDKAAAKEKLRALLDLFSTHVETHIFQGIKLNWKSNFEKNEYIEQVQKTIAYIYAGDIFQANIAQKFEARLPNKFDPFAHYLHLREVNPAPFSCYMNLCDIKISSSSPERFLIVNNGKVKTCPIKGTRPNVSDPQQNQIHKDELLSSEKDRAENTMIVDLMRNDLSKNCTAHSVEVTELCKLESFTSVHHLVSTIKGILRDNKDAIDLLCGCFPGGSITGAPKIRAMEVIEELEPTQRGAYCGSIGYIGFDGNMDSNILIRTLTYENNKVSLQAGGGIVADSNPENEYQETIDKASAIFKSFDIV